MGGDGHAIGRLAEPGVAEKRLKRRHLIPLAGHSRQSLLRRSIMDHSLSETL